VGPAGWELRNEFGPNFGKLLSILRSEMATYLPDPTRLSTGFNSRRPWFFGGEKAKNGLAGRVTTF